ncbi:MAG: prepilin-type N-terminal cleavage/methylation domain-containing protein, partial [Acidobacteriota bacterium]
AGFSIIEVLVVLAVVAILAMLAVSQFVQAYDRSRQRSTLADMRSVAAANGMYRIDNSKYAQALTDLAPDYMDPIPTVDRWGYAWTYVGGSSYSLTSRGSDGIAGPPPPADWTGEPFEADLVLQSGTFTQAPKSQ